MSTPRDERAAARDQSRHLQFLAGRGERIRSRSPSPAPGVSVNVPPAPKQSSREIEDDQFLDALSFGSNMATSAQLAAIRDQLRDEIRAELRVEAAASAATIPDAIRRKPEIPPFDKKHIDIWIRRTENAFIRALCNSPREKFAFLETKFPVDFNPRINEYLWGEATQAKWNEFLAYLRSEYGSTKQQQAAVILDGLKRDGRKPSQYAALLDERTKNVTLDDIKKEMLIREMPTDVQRMLQERIEGLTFKDAAQVADAYFDQEGKPRHTIKSTTVNAVLENTEPSHLSSDDPYDVNAINRRFQNQKFSGQPNSQRNTRTWTQKGGHPRPTNSQPTPQPKQVPKVADPTLCIYHNQFGDKARNCNVTCARYDEKRFSGNGKAGR